MSSPAPAIFDTSKRVLRTAIQTGIPAFLAFAGLIPIVILPALQVVVSPKLYATLVVAAGAITAFSAGLAKLMANPRINTLLEMLGLAGHSGSLQAADTYTQYIPVIAAAND